MSGEGFSAILELWVEKSADTEGQGGEFIGFFEGVASSTGFDLEGDRFSEEVLRRSAERLANKPILLIHGRDAELGATPVGRILEASYVNGKLRIRAGIYKPFEEVWRRVKNGLLKALSIGGLIRAFRKLSGGGREIVDAEISEVSLTPRGMNPEARIVAVFGKSYVVEDGVLCEEGWGLQRLGTETRVVAARPPKALVSGLEPGREAGAAQLLTPVFDSLWDMISSHRRGMKAISGPGGAGGE